MKLRELVYMLGFRPQPREYGWTVERFELPREGCVEFAQWQNPRQDRITPDQAEVDELRSFLRPGDFAIDIGAQVGDTTVPMALAVGRSGCVLALEPNKYVFPILQANANLNHERTNIVPVMAAAASEPGELEFTYSDAGFCNGGFHEGISRWRHGHAFQLRVQAIRVVDLLRERFANQLPRLRFIKTDCEGYDLSVLQSLEEILREHRPHLKVEVYKHSSAEYRRSLYDYLRGLGYRLHRVESACCYRGDMLEVSSMTRWSHFDIFAVAE